MASGSSPSGSRLGALAHAARRALKSALDVNEWVRVLSGAAVHWLFVRRDADAAGYIHGSFLHEAWDEASLPGRLALVQGALLWPVTMLGLASALTARNGLATRRRTGVGLLPQLRQQLGLAARLSVPPYWYYMFEFYDDEKRAQADKFLYRFETKNGIYTFLRKYLTGPETTEALSNKARFAERCAEHGLSVVPALLVAEDGEVRGVGGPVRLPAADLFEKPLRGAGGRGARLWRYREGRYRAEGTTESLDAEDLLQHLRFASRRRSLVVRLRVENHPSLDDLNVGALNTVRVVSCLNETGAAEITHAVLRMARNPGTLVDNFHGGGIAAKVDVVTGALGPATDMGTTPRTSWWTRHPTTGAPIEGRKLELWDETLDLVRRAHEAFGDQVAVGWDVALLPAGPALVEGNKSPDLDIIQRTGGGPVGDSRLGRLLAFHLLRATHVKYGVPPGASPGGEPEPL
jgi:hypothetical protein